MRPVPESEDALGLLRKLTGDPAADFRNDQLGVIRRLVDDRGRVLLVGGLHRWLRVIGHDDRLFNTATTSGGVQYGSEAERVRARPD